MCMIAPILAQKGGEMLGMDIFGAQARKKKQDKKIQERGWERDDKLRAEDREWEASQRAEDRTHEQGLYDKRYGEGSNRDSLSANSGGGNQSDRQRDRAY